MAHAQTDGRPRDALPTTASALAQSAPGDAGALPRFVPPPLPVFGTGSRAEARRVDTVPAPLPEDLTGSRRASPRNASRDDAGVLAPYVLRRPPLPLGTGRSPLTLKVDAPATIVRDAGLTIPAGPLIFDLPELRAVLDTIDVEQTHLDRANSPSGEPRTVGEVDRPKPRPATSITTRIATVQVLVCVALMVAAPLLMLAAGKPSALAFAAHGIGALFVMMLATMAVHKGYPLLRGGNRSWPAFKKLLNYLAIVSVAEGASSMWILWFYHAPDGPGHLFSDSAPIVDQLAMQFKIFAGVGALVLFLVAWWSSRSVSGERGDLSVRAPVFALIVGWLFMVAALVLGTAITWVASV